MLYRSKATPIPHSQRKMTNRKLVDVLTHLGESSDTAMTSLLDLDQAREVADLYSVNDKAGISLPS